MKMFTMKFNLKAVTTCILLLLILGSGWKTQAQDSCHLKISIITCGSGEDLYACYGHSAIRIIDTCAGSDRVYNYGTFNFGDPQFYWKFTRGKLPYYLNIETFDRFMYTYIQEGRKVDEQILELSESDAQQIQAFLENNAKPENKYYRYDFLFDNCSTRIRDIFPKLFGERFQMGEAMESDSCSFRTILNYYERNLHWTRTGVNLLMSHRVDEKMSNEQSMFLPYYLMRGFAGAYLDGNKLVALSQELLPDRIEIKHEVNQAKYFLWIFCIAIFILSFNKTLQPYLLYFDVFLFMILGLLGCFMLFMWLGTEHQVCEWNRNLFWAFPLHLAFAFMIARNSTQVAKYARYASWLIVLSFFYEFIAEQKYITEITPILLLILYRLGKYSSRITIASFTNPFMHANRTR
ncbi:MAG: DUF4105 domain-containing protein [Bacteroidetes bacterium]|nr:DUF4105 domain-containing protein [Bacteroidota bacterium]